MTDTFQQMFHMDPIQSIGTLLLWFVVYLLLLVYGRRRFDDARFDRSGDEQVLRHWLEHSAL